MPTEYTTEQRTKDFEYFIREYDNLFKLYGHKFLAVKNESVLLAGDSIRDVINQMNPSMKVGNYLIQECNGEESAYTRKFYGIRFEVKK